VAATDVLLAAALRRDPSGPLVTYYDDASGERTELSATTLANWVAKTANLVQGEFAAEPGDRIAVRLPAHWQTAAVLLGIWAAGGVVTADSNDCAVAFCTPDSVAAASGGAADVVVLGLAPLGRPMQHPIDAAVDYAAVVPIQPDAFTAWQPIPPDAPALAWDGRTLSGADVVTAATERASALGLGSGDRILMTLPWAGPADWIDLLLAPLAAGASLIISSVPVAAVLVRRVESEAVTAICGPRIEGIRSVSR